MIYKFRILLEDNEDFVRDIEIRSADNFENLHNAIRKSVKFESNELASFFICDNQWNKLKEITLIEMSADELVDDEEDGDRIVPETMEEAILKNYISEPHQRLIYEYDFLNPKTFYLELIKISKEEAGAKYPQCILKRGEMNVEPEKVVPQDVDEAALLEEFNEMLKGEEDLGFEIEEFPEDDY